MPATLSWDDLRFVAALAREQTAASAARALGVTTATVTRRLTALESALGVQLFERSSYGMRPTDAGTIAMNAALRVEVEVLELDAAVRDYAEVPRGRLSLTSIGPILNMWRLDLACFIRKFDEIELSILSSPQTADIQRREADVALRICEAPPDPLVGRRFAEVNFAVYGTEKLAGRSYSDSAWLGWTSPWEPRNDRFLRENAPGARVRTRVDSMEVMLATAEASVGLCVLPCFIGDRRPALQRIGSYFEGGPRLWLLTHEQLRRSPRVRVLMDFLTELLERDASIFEGGQHSSPHLA